MATGALRPHIFLQNTSTTEKFTAPSNGGGSSTVVPSQNRQQHAAALRQQFSQVKVVQQALVAQQQQANVQTAIGVQVEFESMHGVDMAAESLVRDHSGIELMNVRKVGDQVFATVFVSDGKIIHFENLLVDYVAERKNSLQRPMDNQKLIDAIRSVRVATFDSVWTDSTEVLPTDDQQAIWWEVWLPASKHRQQAIDDFHYLASLAEMQTSERALFFPERSVVTLHGTKAQLLQAPLLLNSIAELRRAKTLLLFLTPLILKNRQSGSVSCSRGLVLAILKQIRST